ncbi:MAG: response regulator transcription factor [Bacteroidia bacterium]
MDKNLEKLSLLIVDDHPLFRKAIKRLISNIPFVQSCDEAENGKVALDMMQNGHYDVILLDLMMPVMAGDEAAKIIRNKYPECRIIILTMSDSKAQMIELLEIGVLGYVLKSTDEQELTNAIFDVCQGIPYLSKDVESVWRDFINQRSKNELLKNLHSKESNDLTDREKEIIRMLCKQQNTNDIAEQLSLSTHTINTHRRNIMKKLDTDNVVGIAIYAIKHCIYIP